VPKASTWDIWPNFHVQEYLYNFRTYFYSENKFYLYKTIIDRGTQFFVAILTRYCLNMCIPAVHTLPQEILTAGDGTRKPKINRTNTSPPSLYNQDVTTLHVPTNNSRFVHNIKCIKCRLHRFWSQSSCKLELGPNRDIRSPKCPALFLIHVVCPTTRYITRTGMNIRYL
jgi:hypothetical protein